MVVGMDGARGQRQAAEVVGGGHAGCFSTGVLSDLRTRNDDGRTSRRERSGEKRLRYKSRAAASGISLADEGSCPGRKHVPAPSYGVLRIRSRYVRTNTWHMACAEGAIRFPHLPRPTGAATDAPPRAAKPPLSIPYRGCHYVSRRRPSIADFGIVGSSKKRNAQLHRTPSTTTPPNMQPHLHVGPALLRGASVCLHECAGGRRSWADTDESWTRAF